IKKIYIIGNYDITNIYINTYNIGIFFNHIKSE
ncbi:hypothetical protein, partial [Plasmodium yoelii yoelii]